MNFKSVLLIAVIIGAAYVQESEAVHKLGLLKAKAALVKGKIVAAKAPHIIAHVAVAKEVKAKSKLAIVKTIEAAKATKLAAWSAITAPFRVAKKTIALKIAGLKAAKALKAAKLIKAANIVKNLKKSPLIVPVPFPVPVHSLPSIVPFPIPAKSLPAKKLFEIPAPPSLEQALGPLKSVIAGTRTALKAAGTLPLVAANAQAAKVAPVPIPSPPALPYVAPAPLPYAAPASYYQLVPAIDFGQYSQIDVQPQHVVAEAGIPADTYGPPVGTFGLPQ